MSQETASTTSRFREETSYLRHFLWKYRKGVAIGLGALAVVDIVDVIPPILLKQVVDTATDRGPMQRLIELALMYIGVALIQAIGRYLWRMYLIRSSLSAGRDLRGAYADHLFNLSSSFFERHRLGDLMSLATNDVEAVRLAMGSGILVFADAVFYLVTVPVAMWFLSPKLTLLACIPLPLIPWIVLRNESKVHKQMEKVQECFGRISAMTQESLNGIRVIKSFAQEETQYQKLKALGHEYMQLSLEVARVQSTTGPMMDFAMSLGLIALLFWGGGQMIEFGEAALTLGTFVAFQRYIQRLVWPMAALGLAANYLQRSMSSTKRLKRIFETQTDLAESPSPKLPPLSSGKTRGAIELRNLQFTFPGASEPVLHGIDLKIEAGERVALVGGVASGKSTILSLIPRLYPVASGMISIDGVDINDWPLHELRKQVGYVSQEVFLFSESVFENVAFGLHGWIEKGFSWDDHSHLIEECTRLASIHEEIQGLESAYKTRLGERGVSLSGGQKQRLTIARALAKEPPILVLDDALAAVDLQTEELILNSLRNRPHRNTELVAAHRISTVKDSDRIVVLHQGRIVEMGTHHQLVSRQGSIYWKFFEKQKIQEELDQYHYEFSQRHSPI